MPNLGPQSKADGPMFRLTQAVAEKPIAPILSPDLTCILPRRVTVVAEKPVLGAPQQLDILTMTDLLILTLFPTLVVAAAIGDVLTLRIPNWLNAATALSVLPMAVLAGMPLDVAQWHLLGGAVLLVFGFTLFARGYIGGGDAKLMAAVGLWIGWSALLPFVIVTSLAGGALAILYKVGQLVQTDLEVRDVAWLKRVIRTDLKLPYGIAIATGALWVYSGTWWMKGLI
jgi:prepilin peptidase CpaA